MKSRVSVVFVIGALAVMVMASGEPRAQEWSPKRLADGQPDIRGMWNNADANHTPLELPDELAGRESFTQEELRELAKSRYDATVRASETVKEGDTGFYALYWFDWYWQEPEGGDWPSLLTAPKTGKMPGMKEDAAQTAAYMREHLHDTYANMEAGDRCISRGVLGMMMPTAYNNGTLILQSPGYVVIHSEMIHNARIIPVDAGPHVDSEIGLWEGDPRGHWDGNTLVVESTNFKPVDNMRAPKGRARQTAKRRIVERFTPIGPDTLKYSLTVDDPDTYTEPWTVAFPWRRDNDYTQYEYACHEGNYAVPNSLSGARAEERAAMGSQRSSR
jgi:hypothetical protein